MAISTNGTVLARLAGALYNTQMSNATYKEVASLDPSALANTLYARDFSSSTDLAVATTLVTNLGLASVTGLDNWVAAQLTAAGSAKGAKVVDLLNGFAQMTADTTYGAYATAFNTKVDAALALSQTTDNKGGTFEAAGVVVVSGTTFALTAGVDAWTGGAGNDTVTASHTTLGAVDSLNAGTGNDTLSITDTGTVAFATPSALISGFENVTIRNVNGSAAVAAVQETQTVTLGGTATAGATSFLGVATTISASPTTLSAATEIVANKTAILAGAAAVAAKIVDINNNGAAGTITVVYATTAGDVPALAASATSNNLTFSTGVEVTKGAVAIAAAGYQDTVAAGTFVGATTFTNDNSTSDVKYTSLATGQAVTVNGNTATANGATIAEWGSTVAAPVMNITGGTKQGAVTLTAAGATTLTLNSSGVPLTSTGLTGTNTIGALTVGGTSTSTTNIVADSNLSTGTSTVSLNSKVLNVSGKATSVTLDSDSALSATNLTTIDASGLTVGGVVLGLTDGITSFKGGAGADTITTAANLAAAAVIDAGAGTDVLITRAAADIDTSIEAAKYRGFDTLRVADSQDVSLVAGITKLQLPALTSKTISNISAAQASSITVRADQTTALTLSLKDVSGTTDSVSLNLTSGASSNASTTNVDVAGLSIVGVETLNIAATTGAATTTDASTVSFASGGADVLTAIALSGSADITLSGTNITKPVTLTDTGTGKLTVSGNFATGSVINGSATGVNAFTVGTAEGVTYIGGAGKDTFSFTEASLAADGTTDTVISGGAETDTLTFTDTTVALTDVHFTNVSGMEALTLTGTSGGTFTSGGSFKAAFADGVTITSGTVANGSASTFSLGLYDKAVNLTLATAGDGASTADNVTITTGAGSDTITLTASSWVGGASNGAIKINAGAGSDVITFAVGTFADATDANSLEITGGTGKDFVFATSVNGDGAAAKMAYSVYNIASGDSNVDSYDEYTGFDIATAALASDVLNLSGTPTINAYAATAASGYAASELTVAVATSTGLVTFAGTKASSLTLEQKIAAVQSVVTTTSLDTALFTNGADAYVFQNVTAGDILVRLVGCSGAVSLTTTLTDDIVNTIAIS